LAEDASDEDDDQDDGEDDEEDEDDQPSPRADDGRVWTTREDIEHAVAAEVQARLAREVQAETDRREQKRQHAQQISERRRLREEDPYEYAERDRQLEADAQAQATKAAEVKTVYQMGLQQYDRILIDPLLGALSPEHKAQIHKNPPRGLDGRAALVQWSLDQIVERAQVTGREQGEADARAKLRKNPAFRKELLAEMRAESGDEPELAPSAGPARSRGDMTSIIRGWARSNGVA